MPESAAAVGSDHHGSIRRRPLRVEPKAAARLELSNALEERVGSRHRAIGQVFLEAGLVDARTALHGGQQRLDLGRKGEDLAIPVVVERQHAEAIPMQYELALRPVPDRVGELAIGASDPVEALDLIQREQDLGITLGLELVAGGLRATCEDPDS